MGSAIRSRFPKHIPKLSRQANWIREIEKKYRGGFLEKVKCAKNVSKKNDKKILYLSPEYFEKFFIHPCVIQKFYVYLQVVQKECRNDEIYTDLQRK